MTTLTSQVRALTWAPILRVKMAYPKTSACSLDLGNPTIRLVRLMGGTGHGASPVCPRSGIVNSVYSCVHVGEMPLNHARPCLFARRYAVPLAPLAGAHVCTHVSR